jgi:hypothetical protein
MSSVTTCACLLCQVELRLLPELSSKEIRAHGSFMVSPEQLKQFPSLSILLSRLKSSPAGPPSDELFRGLFAAHAIDSQLGETLLVLAFLPMLHHTVRRVAKHQPALSPDDIAQQALSTLLQFLRSEQLRTRTSHIAFVISRSVKRQMFEWASREGAIYQARTTVNGAILESMTMEESFERLALLRHFLHRCVTKGLLSDSELELLIQFRLYGNNGDNPVGGPAANSSNAARQRMKRLLAKLRRLAR